MAYSDLDGDGRPFHQILLERFPREQGETEQEWLERAYGTAQANRYDPHDTGKVVRSAGNE